MQIYSNPRSTLSWQTKPCLSNYTDRESYCAQPTNPLRKPKDNDVNATLGWFLCVPAWWLMNALILIMLNYGYISGSIPVVLLTLTIAPVASVAFVSMSHLTNSQAVLNFLWVAAIMTSAFNFTLTITTLANLC